MKLTLARVARVVTILAALAAFTIAPTAGAAEGDSLDASLNESANLWLVELSGTRRR